MVFCSWLFRNANASVNPLEGSISVTSLANTIEEKNTPQIITSKVKCLKASDLHSLSSNDLNPYAASRAVTKASKLKPVMLPKSENVMLTSFINEISPGQKKASGSPRYMSL